MAFLESPRFPERVSFGFTGGPEFRTDVVGDNGGWEFRDQIWELSKRVYDASHAAKREVDCRALQSFFYIAAGRANAFRVKDWTDYQDWGAGIFTLLAGSPLYYQMVKRYTSGAATHDREINKPVSGTIVVTGGVVASIDYTTGVVHMTSGVPTAWTGEFDVPCRFGTDRMEVEAINRAQDTKELITSWVSIPILEVRV